MMMMLVCHSSVSRFRAESIYLHFVRLLLVDILLYYVHKWKTQFGEKKCAPRALSLNQFSSSFWSKIVRNEQIPFLNLTLSC